jgi:hypothetical protein
MTRVLPRALQQDINTERTTDIMLHEDYTGIASGSSTLPFVSGPRVGAQNPCTYPLEL